MRDLWKVSGREGAEGIITGSDLTVEIVRSVDFTICRLQPAFIIIQTHRVFIRR